MPENPETGMGGGGGGGIRKQGVPDSGDTLKRDKFGICDRNCSL